MQSKRKGDRGVEQEAAALAARERGVWERMQKEKKRAAFVEDFTAAATSMAKASKDAAAARRLQQQQQVVAPLNDTTPIKCAARVTTPISKPVVGTTSVVCISSPLCCAPLYDNIHLLCLCLYLCLSVSVDIKTHIRIHMHAHIRIYLSTCLYLWIYTYILYA